MKYCQFCGRQLNDDEVCSCTETTGERWRNYYDLRRNLAMPRLGLILRDPSEACTQIANGGTCQEGLMLMVAQGVISSIIAMLVLSQLNSLLGTMGMPDGMGFSLFRAFLLTLLLSVALSSLAAFIFHGIGKALGGVQTLGESFALVSVRSVPIGVFELFSCILMLLSVYLGAVLVLAAGSIVALNYLSVASGSTQGLSRNRALALSVSTAVARVVLLIIFIKLFAQYYLPGYMREAMSDPASMLDNLFGFLI